MQLNPKRYVLITVVFWIVSICGSLTWNLYQLKRSTEAEHINIAKAFVQQILITRAWNAMHGGVYLPVSDLLQPNPYLKVSNRDIMTSDGTIMTLINPAFMTRMISEIAKEQGQIKFHLTSLKPINPGNKAEPWERQALLNFEMQQDGEYFFSDKKSSGEVFNYIKPLMTQKACLQCHEEQGYQEGDIRGGISVSFPIVDQETSSLIFSHLLILFAGVFLFAGFGNKIVQLTETLKKQSNIDGLTQVANRKYFDETLSREWLRSRRMKTSLSLIMCDIDSFKLYNDAYGHQVGDSCLKRVAQTLQAAGSRPADFVARYGGEEFVVILPETAPEGAQVVAELMQAAVENLQIPHRDSSISDYVTVSFGVASMGDYVSTKKQLIERADKALYYSKENGKNIVTHADDVFTNQS